MGSKLSRTVRGERKAPAASPTAASHHDQTQMEGARQETPDYQQTLKLHTTATFASALDAPSRASTSDNDAMDIDGRPRASSDSRSQTILQDLQQLPSGGSDEPLLGQPPPKRKHTPPPVPKCLICYAECNGTDKNSQAVYPCKCGNAYCVSCIKDMFVKACQDVSRMPPRCCNQIPLHHARPYLSQEEVALFRAKYEEWGTPNPFYCPVAPCSAFIPNHLLPRARTGKQRVDSGIGTPTTATVNCPKCETEICTSCRSLAHAGGTCSPLEFGVDPETADLLKKWGYKKCPKCGNGLKRMYGCNHMQCHCGAHFCWVCLKSRDSCDGECEEDDEDYSDSEPDDEEDEDVEVEEEGRPDTPAPPASNLAHVFPHMAPTEQPADTANEVESEGPARVRNLDGGSGRYWEEQGYDFGEEPTDDYQDRSWDCDHRFGTAKIKLADAFNKDSPHQSMECMKCWAVIHPEVLMPKAIRAKQSKTSTTVVASASRRIRIPVRQSGRARHSRRQGTSSREPAGPHSLRGSRSMEGFTASTSQFSTSPASFSSALFPPSSHPNAPGTIADDQERVVDLYGNTVATPKKQDADGDEEIPDYILQEQEDKDKGKSRLTFATKSTPFSFAYECHACNLLVCYRCKDNLLAAAAAKAEAEAQAEAENEGDRPDSRRL